MGPSGRITHVIGYIAYIGLFGTGKCRLTGPDPDTPPGFHGWSRLVEFHCTIPRECTKGPHLKEM